ncbi:MAG: FAD-dependent oxidoreductase [Syntrophothermus sp.]
MKIRINNTVTEVAAGTTVMEAARGIGIDIPSMCYLKGRSNHPSCMICMVEDETSGKIFPSCGMPVSEGMSIITENEEIIKLRKESLELLLSDHLGDCQAPCRISCPAFMNIPLMNRLIAGGKTAQALEIVQEEIAIPLVLGYICPAPCEKACHRRSVDKSISICRLKRHAAEDPSFIENIVPVPSTGKQIAIIGSGPAGLSAAYYLLKNGHQCTLYDRNDRPGGNLLQIPESRLPKAALDKQIEVIRRLGGRFILETDVPSAEISHLENRFDTIILAIGHQPDYSAMTVSEKLFICGNPEREEKMAVRSAAHGKTTAEMVNQFLKTGYHQHEIHARSRRQNVSRLGHLHDHEKNEYLKESDLLKNSSCKDEFAEEASRCLHCDCRGLSDCGLKKYSELYNASHHHHPGEERKSVVKNFEHEKLVYEPQKCIRCGLCVQISTENNKNSGLAFYGKGFDVVINASIGSNLAQLADDTAEACIKACPTGALAMNEVEKPGSKGISGIIFLLILFFAALNLQSQDCWSSFRGDPQLTGHTKAVVSPPLTLLWSFKTGDAIKSSPVVCNNVIFVGSNDGYLYALTAGGKLKWKFNCGTAIEAAPLLSDNLVIAGSLEGILFAVDAASGKLIWKYKTEGQISGAANVTVSSDKKKKMIIVGSYDYNLHCVDAATGKGLWKYESENYINGTAAITGNYCIFGGCDGILHLVDTRTGKEQGSVNVGTYIPASPAISDNKAYFGNYDGEFYSVDLQTRRILWKTPGGGPFLASPAISGDRVVTGAQNNFVYCYDLKNGSLKWKIRTNGKVNGSPVITGKNVVIGSADGKLRFLDLETGKVVWEWDLGSAMYSTPAVVVNKVILGCDDGKVYYFGKK